MNHDLTIKRILCDPAIPLQGPVRILINTALNEIASYSSIRSIIELPRNARSRHGTSNLIDNELATTLEHIGLIGWTAWTIADRIRDGEASDISASLCAFSCLLCSMLRLTSFSGASDDIKRDCIASLIRKMESYNYEDERPEKRVDDIRRISAHKSIGAAIPMTLYLDSIKAPMVDIDNLQRYFQHFILARQIADDIYDVEADMKANKRTLATIWRSHGLSDADIRKRGAREIAREVRYSIACAQSILSLAETDFLVSLPTQLLELVESAQRSIPRS